MDQKPVFVKIDEYKDAINIIDGIKEKLKEANNTLAKLNDVRNKEDAELDQWKSHIEEVEKKLDFIDRSLFETK